MRTRTKKSGFKPNLPLVTMLAAGMMIFMAGVARTASPPDIRDFMVPSTLHQLTATAHTVSADQGELAKINKDFGDAYRLHEVTYRYTAPDTLEYSTRYGLLTGTYTSTNTENVISVPALHIRKATSFGADITKRQTLFALGLLPENYLDTMRVDYVGTDKAWGVDCQVYLLRYSTDPPNDKRRFEIWVDPGKHYVIQKRVWDGGDHQHETIAFLNPKEVLPGLWMPTRADAFAPDGKIAGSIEYSDISAS